MLDKDEHPWDRTLDELKIGDRLRGFEQCNTGEDTVYLLIHNQLEAGKFNKVLLEFGKFGFVQPLFVSCLF